ncbi:hypothetical protein ACVWYF_001631 [Hymenobacter sp. UYAg731]
MKNEECRITTGIILHSSFFIKRNVLSFQH